MTAALVGRSRELDRIKEARASHALGEHVVLVIGDAGIGKTTLLRAASTEAEAAGWRVASGRCWDQAGAPAFWPWVQVLRSLLVARPSAELLEPTRSWVAELDPSLAPLLGFPPPPPDLPRGRARFALLDAAASVLADQCRDTGLLIVLDDLHAADASSLELARFVTRSLSGAGFLLLAASRPTAHGTPGEVRRQLDHLDSEAVRISLTGLAPHEVGCLVNSGRDDRLDDARIRELHRATGGNPFFVSQLLRTRSPADTMPPSVRDVLVERLAELSATARSVLEAAAAFGVDFDPALLPEMSGHDPADVRAAVTEASAAGLIARSDDSSGLWSFTHGLFQRVLVDDLDKSRRAEIHQRIAATLEAGASGDVRWAGAVAAHCRLAVEVVGVERMVVACLAAADAAIGVLALEVAADELSSGLALVPTLATGFAAQRAAMLIALGRTRSMLGDVEASRGSYLRAAEAARAGGRGDLLAACALSMPREVHSLLVDTGMRTLIEEALGHVGDDHPHLRAPLMARLASELPFEAPGERREMSDRALALARTVGERTVAEVLRLRAIALHDSELTADRLDDAQELVRIAIASGDLMLELDAWLALFSAWLSTGDVQQATHALSEFDRRSRGVNAPHLQAASMIRHGTLAFLRGRFADVLRLAEAARLLSVRAGDPNAERSWRSQVISTWNLQGNPACAEAMAELPEDMPIPRWVVGKFLYEGGRVAQARVELRRGLTELDGGRAALWVSALAAGAELANRFDDTEVALAVLPLLEHAGAGFGVAGDGALCLGSNELWVGQALATLGRYDEAAEHLRRAVAANEAVGAAPFAVRAKLELARVLLRRNDAGDVGQAQTCLLDVERLAAELPMPWTVRDARALRATISATPAQPVADDPPWQLRRDGDVWALNANGRSVHLRHSKGLEYLAVLIASPGREIAALDLAAGRCGTAVGPSPVSAVLDEQAQRAYRSRLAELQQDADAADARGDVAGADEIEVERAALLSELRRASGLGGRTRTFGDEAERARVNVTRTIRQALERVSAAEPSLGAHLSHTVRTGTRCVYQPDLE
ncbi:MAG: hypothetical protein QOG01_4111 [Pseudonocardiales bacterium]|nr:hypothetical protein [Pseudonocardiales bacterium]